VHPDFQKRGLGKVLLKSYVQRIKDSGVAKRVALICRDRYIPFYAKAGFTNVGKSKYGGGGWVDMVLDLEEGGGDGGEQDGY
jgi:GNAT superfamily N-acetyltransferase